MQRRFNGGAARPDGRKNDSRKATSQMCTSCVFVRGDLREVLQRAMRGHGEDAESRLRMRPSPVPRPRTLPSRDRGVKPGCCRGELRSGSMSPSFPDDKMFELRERDELRDADPRITWSGRHGNAVSPRPRADTLSAHPPADTSRPSL